MQRTQPATGYNPKATYHKGDYNQTQAYPKSNPRHYEESGHYRGNRRQDYYERTYEEYPPKLEAVTEDY